MGKIICPKCNEEMKKGYVYSERRFKWSNNQNSVFTTYKDETILPFNFGFTHRKREGYRCERCKIITFEY